MRHSRTCVLEANSVYEIFYLSYDAVGEKLQSKSVGYEL